MLSITITYMYNNDIKFELDEIKLVTKCNLFHSFAANVTLKYRLHPYENVKFSAASPNAKFERSHLESDKRLMS